MGIASFSQCFSRTPVLSVLLTPLQALIGLFGPAASASGNALLIATKGASPFKPAPDAYLLARQTSKKSVLTYLTRKSPLNPVPSRLKIVRAFEPGVGSSCAGRMKISGSMAEVCAELDRMAQGEAATCHQG